LEELIAIIKKWYKSILKVVIAAAIISAIISLILPEYFTSQVTFIPANPHIMDRGNVFDSKGGNETVYLFGGPNDINRLMSLVESRSLEEYLIDKFDLYKHYDIDTNDVQKKYWVKEELRTYMQLVRTPEGMLQVKVLDKDPQFAATMANDVVARLDTLNREIVTEKKRNLEKLYKREVEHKRQEFDALKDSLLNTVRNNPKDTVMAKILKDVLKNTMSEYIGIKNMYEQHQSALNEDFSTIYILEQAEAAVKRSTPVRWRIVVTATLCTFLIMLITAFFVERYKGLFS
jgi:capsular polysaccharide biosynthesis protein